MRTKVAATLAVSTASLAWMSSVPVASADNVLTVTGYTAGGLVQWDMADIFQGAYCTEASGNSCIPVNYLSGLAPIAEVDGLRALSSAIKRTPAPITVIGFSQGSAVASEWIRGNSGWLNPPGTADPVFVLAANPWRKYGGSRTFAAPWEATPGSEYQVLDIAVEYDGAADFPDNPLNLLAVANAIAGFQYIHIPGYGDVDLENDEKLTWREGNTTYVLVRTESIPLLEPLRLLGLNALADQLNDPLKAIIDTAYDRNYEGLQTRAAADEDDSSATEVAQIASIANTDFSVGQDSDAAPTESLDVSSPALLAGRNTRARSVESDVADDTPAAGHGHTSGDVSSTQSQQATLPDDETDHQTRLEDQTEDLSAVDARSADTDDATTATEQDAADAPTRKSTANDEDSADTEPNSQPKTSDSDATTKGASEESGDR